MDTALIYQLFTTHPYISIDSRNIKPGSLFFALKGENFDANHYAKEALSKGASFAIVDNPEVVSSDKYILVNDALNALQQLALLHRKQFTIPVLAITGSNGKTTTKELVASVLAKKFNVLYTKGNLNNHIGLPLTLLELTANHEMAVVEMGANHVGEIKNLCQIALPTFGLITNIGRAHLEGFGSFEGVVAAKTEMYEFIREQWGKVFINSSDELLMHYAANISRVNYAMNDASDYRGVLTESDPFISMNITENCSTFELKTQLTGIYNTLNILVAVCIGRYFGVPVVDIQEAIASYTPQNNRSQVLKTERNNLLLDAYNANPSSMAAALENFSKQQVQPRMCILGDMYELGSYTAEEHRNIIKQALHSGFDKLYFVGEHFFKQKIKHPDCEFFADTRQAKAWFAENKISGYNILIKGSRKMQLETLVEEL